VRSTVGAALAERGGPEIVAVRAIYVAVRQTIRAAWPGAATAVDVRHGERVRVEVTVRSRETTACAAGERVLRRGRDPGLDVLARGIAVRAALRLDAGPVRPGSYPAVFAPGVGGILVHEIVGHALEADVVLRGASRLAAEAGRVAGAAVRILDDPRRARVAWRFDDEGTPSRAIALLEGGRVAGCLHDRSTADASGEGPTGHGRCASFRDPILPRMGCTFLAAGPARPEEAFEGVREGLLIRRMAAAAADPSSGRAVFRVEDADRISVGRIVGPVAPFLFEVDALAALRSMDVVADDLDFDTCVGSCARDGQPLAISVGAPTCRLGSIRVLA
jgi:TldD protein